MDYSVESLTTPADCQALINIASSEKQGLQHKRQGLMMQHQSNTLNAAEIEAELASVTTELEILQQVLDSVPPGKLRDETIRKFEKSKYKKFLLTERSRNYGILALLQKEYDIASIDQQVTETDVFITAVTERMTELN